MHARATHQPTSAPKPQRGQVPPTRGVLHSSVARMTPSDVLALQRSMGNAAVVQLLGKEQESTASVQRSAVHEELSRAGAPLAAPLKAEMEARLGADFSDVRIHMGSSAQQSAEAIGARAYTSGSHIVIGEGGADKHTLAHELTHVIQQRQGAVAGTDNGSGLRVSDPSDRFERAAEASAHRVMSMAAPSSETAEQESGHAAAGAGDGTVQRVSRHRTKKSLLTESDSDYSSEDDLTAVSRNLPRPTSYGEVREAVESGRHRNVVLYRGTSMSTIDRILTNGSAGGSAANPHATAPSTRDARHQVGHGRSLPEYTCDPTVARAFSRGGGGIVVISVDTYYLARGSASEEGWVIARNAPVTVLAVVDRTDGRTGSGAAANAS
jgi:uncharacterized protein DUF4765/uncharacterized protein DUF4157